jgi:hypothetical protein
MFDAAVQTEVRRISWSLPAEQREAFMASVERELCDAARAGAVVGAGLAHRIAHHAAMVWRFDNT